MQLTLPVCRSSPTCSALPDCPHTHTANFLLFFTFVGELNSTIKSTSVRFLVDFPRDKLTVDSILSIAIVGSDPRTGDPTTTEVRFVRRRRDGTNVYWFRHRSCFTTNLFAQIATVDVNVEVDLRHNRLVQEVQKISLTPAILEVQLRVAAAGLAKDEELMGRHVPHTSHADIASQQQSRSITDDIKSGLAAAVSAYEATGGLWGAIAKMATGSDRRTVQTESTHQDEHAGPSLPQASSHGDVASGNNDHVARAAQRHTATQRLHGSVSSDTQQREIQRKTFEEMFDI